MKNLLQIPRDISAKFCWRISRPGENSEEKSEQPERKNEHPITKLESKKIRKIVDPKLELAQLQEEIAIKEWKASLEKNDIPGLSEEAHKDREITFALEASNPKFDFKKATENTDNYLANLANEMNGGSFDSRYQNIG